MGKNDEEEQFIVKLNQNQTDSSSINLITEYSSVCEKNVQVIRSFYLDGQRNHQTLKMFFA